MMETDFIVSTITVLIYYIFIIIHVFEATALGTLWRTCATVL